MKKRLCSLLCALLLAFCCTACSPGEQVSSQPDSLPIMMEMQNWTLRETIVNSTAIVRARLTKIVPQAKMRELHFQLVSALDGDMPQTFIVSDWYSDYFIAQEDYAYAGYGESYEAGRDYILVLTKFISPYELYDQYNILQYLHLPLSDDGTIAEARKLGRPLQAGGDIPPGALSSLTGFQSYMRDVLDSMTAEEAALHGVTHGDPFTRSEDLSVIVAEAESVLKVRVGHVEYPSDRNRYPCDVLNVLKGEDPGEQIQILFRKDQVTEGEIYLVTLCEDGYSLSATHGILPVEREAEVEAALSQLSAT